MTTQSSRPFFSVDQELLSDTLNHLQSINRIFLDSAERLTALNLSTARQAVEDWGNIAQATLAASRGEADLTLGDLAPELTDKALAYLRTSSEIFGRTQQQIGEVVSSQFARHDPALGLPEGWRPAFALLTESLAQLATLTAPPRADARRSATVPAKPQATGHATAQTSPARKAA